MLKNDGIYWEYHGLTTETNEQIVWAVFDNKLWDAIYNYDLAVLKEIFENIPLVKIYKKFNI